MKIYQGSGQFPKTLPRPIVALGNFDGVHLAHQKMFQHTKRLAKQCRGKSIVYTFEPHPVKVLAKATAPLLINTLEQKLELIEKTGIDGVVLEPFNRRLAQMRAEDWFKKILIQKLHAHGVVAGYDFTFGTHRSGTAETLHQLTEQSGMKCEILDAQLFGETLISSSQIRRFVTQGQMQAAMDLLGRPFFLDGVVIQGMGRGAALGMRTANLKPKNELLPAPGVYACWVRWKKRRYRAVTNLGINPTFGGQTLSLETHLLNFNQEIYGETLRVFFMKRIREERTFGSPEKLIAQIQKDIQAAQKFLQRPPKN